MLKAIVNIIENVTNLIDYFKERKEKNELRRQGRQELELELLRQEQAMVDKLKGIGARSKLESERNENRRLYADND
jgi:hypothetical protein